MTTMESPSFGVLLRRLRLAAGLTQEGLAERAGISAKAISDLERDPNRSPRLETVTLLAEALRLDGESRTALLTATQSSKPVSNDGRVPPTLPRPLTSLFGRAGVAEAVAELLRRSERSHDARLLTLTGIGGVGKTRLAIAATELAADAFPHGVFFVDLAPLRDPQQVLPAIAAGLGVDERDNTPLSDRLNATLRTKRLLLLLDNVEHLLPAREAILALLEACPALVVLATSRVPLRVRGEREYRVAPLEVPDAAASPEMQIRSPSVALFLDRALAAGADLPLTAATTPAVTEICRRLDGLPLAIELAAGWSRLLPPPALLARLERRLPLLIGGPHDLPTRQRTMRDAIAWSYDLLHADEQRLFRRLAVFIGGCTPEAAIAVGEPEMDETAALSGLGALVDRSLLRSTHDDASGATEPRLTMLETLREYGLEHLEERGEAEDARRAHALHFLALAESAALALHGPEAIRWGARLALEHDNLRGALGWSLACGEATIALSLSGALWHFWSERGYLGEGRRWLREALALSETAGVPDIAARARALVGAAHLAIDQGAHDEAETHCEAAIALARAHGMHGDLVAALNAHGLLARERGDYEAGSRCHEEALALAESEGDPLGKAEALTGLGYAVLFSGDVARGVALCEQSLAILRAAGDQRSLATALIGLAVATSHAGAFAQADAHASEALLLFRALGDTGRAAEALWVLGVSALSLGYYDRAIPLFEEMMALCLERGDEHGAIQPLSALGLIALLQGEHGSARVLIEEALGILDRYDDRWSRAMFLTLLGHVELAAGDPARAVERFAAAAPLFRAISNPLYLPWCLEGLAGVATLRSAWDLAARLCGARDALHAGLGMGMPPAHPARYAQTLAASRAALGDDAFATAHAAGHAWSSDQALVAAGVITLDEKNAAANSGGTQ